MSVWCVQDISPVPMGSSRERMSPLPWRPGGEDMEQDQLSDSIEWGKMALGAYSGSSIHSSAQFGSAAGSQYSSVSHSAQHSQEFAAHHSDHVLSHRLSSHHPSIHLP
jgi:hypothetical protein